MTIMSAVLGVLFLGGGLLLIRLARMSAVGTLKRNPIAGYRTELTMSSDDAWFAAQKAIAPYCRRAAYGMLTGSVVLVAVAVMAACGVRLPMADLVVAAVALCACAWALVCLGRGTRPGREAAQSADSQPPEA